MKNYIKFVTLLLLMVLTSSSYAFTAPNPPPNGTYVLDLANKLSIEQVSTLNQKIEAIKSNSSNEFGVLILQSMDGSNIEDVAYSVFNSWGIGKKELDNGVLIVIAVSERKTRIETGKGVGELTDLQSNDILANTLRPFLKSGDYFGGINATIDAASSAIASRKNVESPAVSNKAVSNPDSELLVLFCIFCGIGFIGLVSYLWIVSKREKKNNKKIADAYENYIKLENEQARTIAQNKISTKNSSIRKELISAGAFTAAEITAVTTASAILERSEEETKRHKRQKYEHKHRDSYSSTSSSSYDSSSWGDSGNSWDSGSSGSGWDGGSSGGGGSSSDF